MTGDKALFSSYPWSLRSGPLGAVWIRRAGLGDQADKCWCCAFYQPRLSTTDCIQNNDNSPGNVKDSWCSLALGFRAESVSLQSKEEPSASKV